MRATYFKVVSLFLSCIFIASCGGGPSGELIGIQNRPRWEHVAPFGMIYIPAGTLHIGPSGEDVNFAMSQRSKSISVSGFYMDDTEITNNEYRQFVNWVKDSIAHKLLGEDHLIMNEVSGKESINWRERIDWNDEDNQILLSPMYYNEADQFWGKKQLDVSQLNYEYFWRDFKEAARPVNKGKAPSAFEFIKPGLVNVYPDTLVWVRDFTYSYNEPVTRTYFWHPAYDHYPVVGVTWEQARAFGIWRTRLWNQYRYLRGEIFVDDIRVPYEAEWEYAARGGKFQSPYSWGGPYLRNSKGCILANFKPGRGNYPDDGGFYTVTAYSYLPNDYGLYNMSGNVAEWTSTTFDENSYAFTHDLNSDYNYIPQEGDPEALKRKVIRGGSWKDIAYYLETGTRSYEYMDSTKSYIGFRCSMSFLGRSILDNPQENVP
ncbi:MAG: SUMF1/EgtB/PvdO family nonheme iron enzyme, partial [Bacteroidetes bacterium]|nr:SUMF1/EgtB/PvdO family nonheme iron enzyme [Bacteroidota bacterium]